MVTPVPASTADIMPEKLSCSSTTRGFCFNFEKIIEIIIMFRIVFVGEADQRFDHNLGNRNGAASGKRMLRSHCHANAFVKQLLISHVVQH
jgi:hypothetical protein